MAQMYVVIGHRGPHYEHETWVEVCSDDRLKVVAWILKKKAANAAELAFQIKLADLHDSFRNENPIPEPTDIKMMEKPRWPTGLGAAQITEKMRLEREAVLSNNTEFGLRSRQLQQDWIEQKWFPVYRQFMTDHGRTVPDEIQLHNTTGGRYIEEIDYEIEEIEQI